MKANKRTRAVVALFCRTQFHMKLAAPAFQRAIMEGNAAEDQRTYNIHTPREVVEAEDGDVSIIVL